MDSRDCRSGFGVLLRQCRTDAGLTQEELADRCGLSVRAIADIERGRTARPYGHTVARLAGGLRLTGEARDDFIRLARRPAATAAAADPAADRGGPLPAGPAQAAQTGQARTATGSTGPWESTDGPPPPVPRQLPAKVAHFAGRLCELDALNALLDDPARQQGAVVLSAVAGTAGVGKTALAVHWAHEVAGRFPDGQLYVNLRGYDPGQPVLPADALAGFLRSLGVPGREVPADPGERETRYRTLLAGKRMLVLLDNAGSAEQVRPLLPGSPGCVAVVTSRDALAGLVARDGAHRLDLDILPLTEAVGLLRALIGDRVDADPDAAAAMALQCARLPLALRVAAELAAASPDARLASLAAELADQQRRLDLLDAYGDPRAAVRAVFSWSYRYLSADAARAFRLLGLHPGSDCDGYALAALTGSSLRHACRMLDLLSRAYLIQAAGAGRFSMHDLLRAYARERALGQQSEQEQRAAVTRLFDHYLHTAGAAMDALYPSDTAWRPAVPASGSPAPQLTEWCAARAWLEAERATLVALARHADEHGWPGHAISLSPMIYRYFESCCHYPEIVIIGQHARHAAHATGDQAAEAMAMVGLGVVDSKQGRYEQAICQHERALTLFQAAGDRVGEARALNNVGLINFRQGRYEQAIATLRRALVLQRKTGDQTAEAGSLSNVGLVELRTGRYRQAAVDLRQALAISRQIADPDGAYHLAYLGIVELRQGSVRQAASLLRQAVTVARETSDRAAEACALTNLGLAEQQQGKNSQAIRHHQRALALCRETGDRSGEAAASNGLGEAYLATYRHELARAQCAAALEVASQIGDKYEQARALDGLGRVHAAAGDQPAGDRHWRQALAIYDALGVPEVDQVRARLARPIAETRYL